MLLIGLPRRPTRPKPAESDICVPSPSTTQGGGINETPEEFWSNPKCPKMEFAATLMSRNWPVPIAKGRRNQRAVASFSAVIFSRAWRGTRIAPSRGWPPAAGRWRSRPDEFRGAKSELRSSVSSTIETRHSAFPSRARDAELADQQEFIVRRMLPIHHAQALRLLVAFSALRCKMDWLLCEAELMKTLWTTSNNIILALLFVLCRMIV